MSITKGEFAKLVGRAPSAVSNWIAEGKLTGDALVGEGHRARINVEVALGQLGVTLDLSQQLAQRSPILTAPRHGDGELPLSMPGQVPASPVSRPSSDQERLLKAKADREELELRMAHAKAEEQAGRWMLTAEAREVWSQQLSAVLQAVETWLITGAAPKVASIGGADPREVASELRSGFRELRQRMADDAERSAGEMRTLAVEATEEDLEDA